jgi:long-chain fatty acid transport protein
MGGVFCSEGKVIRFKKIFLGHAHIGAVCKPLLRYGTPKSLFLKSCGNICKLPQAIGWGLVILTAIAAFGLMLLDGPTTANASGFALYTHGARELGRINSVVASPEGPVSSFFNPATLTEISGNQVEAGTILIFPSVKFRSASTGETEETKSQVFHPGTLFGVYHLNDTFTLGFGVNSPFGLGTEWPEDWEGRYITTNAEMETFLFNPNLAWKVTDTLTLAGGIDLLLGDAILENNISLFAYGLPDGKQKFFGDGYGLGYNLGVLWKIKRELSLGVSYRSGIDLKLEGDLHFSGAPFQNTGGKTTINLPPQIFTGLAYQVNDNLIVEIGGRWEGWSRYKELKIDLEQPVAGQDTIITEKNWKDTLAFNTGARYSVNPTMDILLGYLYEDNPVPDDTFEPSVSASEKHMLSLGAAKRFGRVKTAITYLYGKYKDRDKDNLVGAAFGLSANGEYKQDTHMLGVSVNVEF